jgi:hypothetical protein
LSRRIRILGAAADAAVEEDIFYFACIAPECRSLGMQVETPTHAGKYSSDIHLHVCTCTRAHSMCRVVCTTHACMHAFTSHLGYELLLKVCGRSVVINSEDALHGCLGACVHVLYLVPLRSMHQIVIQHASRVRVGVTSVFVCEVYHFCLTSNQSWDRLMVSGGLMEGSV